MSGLGLNAIFISYPDGFACGIDGTMAVEADVVKDLRGVSTSVKRRKLLRVKDTFFHGRKPEKNENVNCLTRLAIGSVFLYSGYVDFVSDKGFIGVILTSNAKLEGVPEFIEAISSV